MARASGLLIITTLVALAACGDDDDDPSTTSTEAPTVTDPRPTASEPTSGAIDDLYPDTTLDTSVELGDGMLTITYRLTNTGPSSLAVVTALPDQLEAGRPAGPDDEGAWVTASDRGVVTIGRWGIRRPSPDGDAAPSLPIYASELAPGAAVDGSITVAWPLAGRRPYSSPTDAPPIPDAAPTVPVRVCVGVGPADVLASGQPLPDTDPARIEVAMDDLRTVSCSPATDVG